MHFIHVVSLIWKKKNARKTKFSTRSNSEEKLYPALGDRDYTLQCNSLFIWSGMDSNDKTRDWTPDIRYSPIPGWPYLPWQVPDAMTQTSAALFQFVMPIKSHWSGVLTFTRDGPQLENSDPDLNFTHPWGVWIWDFALGPTSSSSQQASTMLTPEPSHTSCRITLNPYFRGK